ncbi:MAG: DUF4810 domain-containing protein [Alphaproteobacteria bacterium PA3]|nr:MAG: DUF4810 domain-containing protein [Alphaproteobacteria bacterium PA3]
MRYIFITSFILLSGCSTGNGALYEWAGYQPALVKYYKNKDVSEFEVKVREAVEKGEKSKKVAPGLYAELGYLLYAKGEFSEAAKYFGLEKSAFPESSLLMDKMIAGSASSEQKKGELQ